MQQVAHTMLYNADAVNIDSLSRIEGFQHKGLPSMHSSSGLTTPMMASNLLGDRPKPTATPPMEGLEEVT